jgi:GNAT superfamily N-acetyltransferase
VLVALADERIVGFATTRPSPDEDAEPDTAEVSGLYVEPDVWGQGVGGTLLESVLERLRLGGVKSATLWVLAANDRARRFYEKRNWTLDGAERVHPERRAAELRYMIMLA